MTQARADLVNGELLITLGNIIDADRADALRNE